jgi:hypothetical protein
MPRAASSPLARVRRVCLSLPETSERESHGAPSFFVRDKVCFVNYMDNHHEDGRLALWCACPPGMRDGLVKAEPDQYSSRRTWAFAGGSACVWIVSRIGTMSSM